MTKELPCWPPSDSAGTARVVRRTNFLPVLEGALFGPLKDLNLFNQVALSPRGYTLLWPNGADFDPATLHDWPEVEAP